MFQTIYNYYYNLVKYMNTCETVYYDFETTGLNPFHDKIIEYAFVRENDDTSISSLVNPLKKFPKFITDLTGIYPENLNNKLPISEKIHEITEYLMKKNSRIFLVAHNNDGFDKWFFRTALKEHSDVGYNSFEYIDSLTLSKMLFPKFKSHSMKNLCKEFNIDLSAHRAMDDTQALRQVYHKLLEELGRKTGIEWGWYLYNPNEVYNYIYGN